MSNGERAKERKRKHVCSGKRRAAGEEEEKSSKNAQNGRWPLIFYKYFDDNANCTSFIWTDNIDF